MIVCLHCGTRPAGKWVRGLCLACYRTPAVRALYPTRHRGRRPKGGWEPEPTAAELEETIRQQLACLPDWWFFEAERERKQPATWGGTGR